MLENQSFFRVGEGMYGSLVAFRTVRITKSYGISYFSDLQGDAISVFLMNRIQLLIDVPQKWPITLAITS